LFCVADQGIRYRDWAGLTKQRASCTNHNIDSMMTDSHATAVRITILSAIIKGSPKPCCSIGSGKRVARGWVGSCVITIKTPRELPGKSRLLAVTLLPGGS
jgi:hypothetical protein